jgi:hypothetical protein
MSHKNRRGKIWKTARLSEKEMHRVKQTWCRICWGHLCGQSKEQILSSSSRNSAHYLTLCTPCLSNGL